MPRATRRDRAGEVPRSRAIFFGIDGDAFGSQAHSALVGLLGEAEAKQLVAAQACVLRMAPHDLYAIMGALGELVGADHATALTVAHPQVRALTERER